MVALLALITFAPSLSAGWTFDDKVVVLVNPDVVSGGVGTSSGQVGTNGWLTLWRHDYWGHDLAGPWTHKSYRPLTVISLKLTHAAVGRLPAAYHAGNVALHAAASVALFYWTRHEASVGAPAASHARRDATLLAFAAAAVFAVHPVNAEVAANIASRAESLAALLGLCAANAHARALPAKAVRWRYVALAVLLAAASLLSKEVGGMVLPALAFFDLVELAWCLWEGRDGAAVSQTSPANSVNALAEATPVSRMRGGNVRAPADVSEVSDGSRGGGGTRDDGSAPSPLPTRLVAARMCVTALAGAALLGARHLLTGGTSISFPKQFNPLIALEPRARLATLPYVWSQAIMLLLWPARLSFDHSGMELPEDPSTLGALAPVVALSGVATLLLTLVALGATRAHAKLAAKAFLLGGLTYLPASNLFFQVGFVIAERALYLPCAAACVTLACVFARDALRSPRVASLALFALLTFGGARSSLRCSAWESEMDLYNAALEVYPRCGLAAYGRGYLFFGMGDYERAAQDFALAIDIDVNDKKAHWMKGRAAYMLSDLPDAERWLRNSVIIDTDFWGHADLGLVKWQTGRREEGAEHMWKALDAVMHDSDSLRVTHLNNAACSHSLVRLNGTVVDDEGNRKTLDTAQALYKRAIRGGDTIGKRTSLYRYNLARLHALLGELEPAAELAGQLEVEGDKYAPTLAKLIEQRRRGEPVLLDCVLEFAT